MTEQEPTFDGMTEQELDAKCCRLKELIWQAQIRQDWTEHNRLQIELLHREQDLRDFDIIAE